MCACAVIGTLLAWLCPIAIAAVLYASWQHWTLERALYPSPSRTSLADVRELVQRGCRKEAILRYREKFPHVDLREAVYAVDTLR